MVTGVRPGGAAIDDGDVQVRVGAHGQRAGNGGGGHNKLVGYAVARGAFVPKGQALIDPEAMLFINHHNPQALEGYAFLKERVGAYHHGDGPGGKIGLQSATLLSA